LAVKNETQNGQESKLILYQWSFIVTYWCVQTQYKPYSYSAGSINSIDGPRNLIYRTLIREGYY